MAKFLLFVNLALVGLLINAGFIFLAAFFLAAGEIVWLIVCAALGIISGLLIKAKSSDINEYFPMGGKMRLLSAMTLSLAADVVLVCVLFCGLDLSMEFLLLAFIMLSFPVVSVVGIITSWIAFWLSAKKRGEE